MRRFYIGKFGRTTYVRVVRVPSLRRSSLLILKPTTSRDPRSPAAPLRVHSSTHSEDITALHFYRNGKMLLSASSDGLVCTSNAEETDEDEAGVHVGNWGCSIAQAGWMHDIAGRPAVWASSDMETFSVWTSEVLHPIFASNLQFTHGDSFGQLDRLLDVDIRQPSVHRQDLTWVTDYLIGCHTTLQPLGDSDSDLCIFAGSNECAWAPSLLSHLLTSIQGRYCTDH